MLTIKFNGQEFVLDEGSTVRDLMERQEITCENTIASVSDKIINPDQYAATVLNDGDVVDLMSFVGGG